MIAKEHLTIELCTSDLHERYKEHSLDFSTLSIHMFNINQDIKNKAWFIVFINEQGYKVLKNKGEPVTTTRLYEI